MGDNFWVSVLLGPCGHLLGALTTTSNPNGRLRHRAWRERLGDGSSSSDNLVFMEFNRDLPLGVLTRGQPQQSTRAWGLERIWPDRAASAETTTENDS